MITRPLLKETLFDAIEANRQKERGMRLATTNRESLLAYARQTAVWCAKKLGEVTMDDVYKHGAYDLGNAAGSVFRGPEWEFTGRWIKSTRVSNHGRWIRVWRLRA